MCSRIVAEGCTNTSTFVCVQRQTDVYIKKHDEFFAEDGGIIEGKLKLIMLQY